MQRRAFIAGLMSAPAMAQIGPTPITRLKPGSVEIGLPKGVSYLDPRIAAVVAKHQARIGLINAPINFIEFIVAPSDEADFIVDVLATGIVTSAERVPMGTPPVFSSAPNDPYYTGASGLQWYVPKMNIDGATGAWGRLGNYGSSSVIIADLNTGNSASTDAPPNTRTGWNIHDSNTNTADMDTSFLPWGHGTATESTVFAAANNTNGIAGIANGCTLMPVVVYYINVGNTTTDSATVALGITWAADNGAHIISVVACLASTPTAGMQAAINHARGVGCLVVVGSNDGNPVGTASAGLVTSPGDCSGVLCAVPTNGADGVPTFFGGIPRAGVGVPGNLIQCWGKDNTATADFGGISFSAPLLAGVAGLVKSANSHLSSSDIATIIASTCDRVTGQSGWTTTAGIGRVNAGNAVKAALQGYWPDSQRMTMGVG